MSAHLLIIGGEDHDLRLPFLVKLREHGYRVTAAGTGDGAPFARSGIAYVPFRFERFIHPLADIKALKSIRELVDMVRPDLVQCFDTKLNLLVPLALRHVHVPVVRTINGRGWLYSSNSPTAVTLRGVYRALHRLAARSTRAEVFEHDEDRRFFEQHGMVGTGGSFVIAGAGVDVDGFERARANGRSALELRREFGLRDAEVVMTVTRMTRQKGIGTLLQAAAEVHAVRPSVRFMLVGSRESEGPLAIPQADIDAHAPYVIATGARSDVPALLGIADVFAFPTEYREGIPRALCEAALAHVPIVTTSMPGCLQVIRDSWNGYVVPPNAPSHLARRILDLLNDRETASLFGQRGAQPVRQLFSLDTITSGYAKLYDSVLSSQVAEHHDNVRHEQAA